MKHNIFSNLGLKIASLAIAFVVWLVILNVSNPVTPRTLTGIPVNITNGSFIESMNQSYRIADGYDTVSVTIRGNRSVVERLAASDVNVTADLTQIIDMNSDPVMVPVSVTVPGISQENITTNPSNIRIILEDMKSKDFVISAVTGSSTPANGYEVGRMTVNPERITIKGPGSIVDRIDRVQAEVDVSNMTENGSLTPTLHIYDKNGDELTDTSMSYLSYNLEEEDISVTVILYEVVSDIAIEAETYGEPADGYHVGDITVTPSTISLAGSKAAIRALEEAGNKITIDSASKAVDVSGATQDVEISVNLPDYLTDGMRVQDGLSDTVVVSVKILQYNTVSIEIDTKDIGKKNVADGYSAVFADASIDVRVRGSDEVLQNLTASDLTASVDFTGLTTEGDQVVPVDITLPAGCSLAEDVETEVTISKNVTAADTASVTPSAAAAGANTAGTNTS